MHWRGYFWQCKLGLSHEGGTKVSISAGCSAGAPRFAGYEAGPFLYQTQVGRGQRVELVLYAKAVGRGQRVDWFRIEEPGC